MYLGVQTIEKDAGKIEPQFGPIPAEVYNQIAEEPEEDKKVDKAEKRAKKKIAFMRLELTQAEFERTHRLFRTWERRVKERKLPHADAPLNGLEFIKQTAQSLNQCRETLKLPSVEGAKTGEIARERDPRHRSLEYIVGIREQNDKLHVPDAAFPWSWRPVVQLSAQ